MANEEKIYQLMTSHEFTVEGLIRDIVYREGLDPWNIDIVILSNKFIEAVKEDKDWALSQKK